MQLYECPMETTHHKATKGKTYGPFPWFLGSMNHSLGYSPSNHCFPLAFTIETRIAKRMIAAGPCVVAPSGATQKNT